MLLDRDDFWLNSEYRSWITDPEDPEVKRAQAMRKARGIKPPQHPILAPVALRPKQFAEIRRKQYEEAIVDREPVVGDRKIASSREFARLLAARQQGA